MEIRCFHSLAEVAPFREQLDVLSQQSRRRDPFSTLGFIENFAKHDAYTEGDRDAQPWFLIAFEQSTPIGYLPLRRVIEKVLGVKTAKLEFFVTHDGDCPYLVARPNNEARCSEAFYRYLFTRRREWAVLDFDQQLGGSWLYPPPASLALEGYDLRSAPTREGNTIEVRWKSVNDYFQALGTQFRTEVRRKLGALLAAGEVSCVSSADPNVTPVLFELLRTLEHRTWRSGSTLAIGSHPDRVDFFRGLLAADQPMRIQITLLLMNGVPIAGSMAGRYEDSLYSLAMMHDDAFDNLAPGAAVVLLQMKQAIDGGCSTLNFLSGYSYFKKRWLAESSLTMSGKLYRTRSLQHLKVKLTDLRRRVIPDGLMPELRDLQPYVTQARLAPAMKTTPDPEWVGSLVDQARAHGSWLRPDQFAALLASASAPATKKPIRIRTPFNEQQRRPDPAHASSGG